MNREDKIRIACDEYVGHKKNVGEDISISLQRAAFADGANWMEKEIFNQLKEALDYCYLFDSYSLDEHEVDNLQDYLKLIKNERTLEKEMVYEADRRLVTYRAFVEYLSNKSIGDTTHIIDEFNSCTYVNFEGYKTVTKEIIDNDLYLIFEIGELTFKAKWQAGDNYAVWQK